MSGLIEGLPDAVALQCLARVPFKYHHQLQLVSRAWQTAFCSQELFKTRDEIGVTEELLCVSASEPENTWQVYDPIHNSWMTLPPLPSEIKHLINFGAVSVAGKLYVLGGGSDDVDPVTGDTAGIFATNEVWAYDPACRKWSKKAAMLFSRAMFACVVLDRHIIVAGGITNSRKSIWNSEIYDPERDVWEPLADLQQKHSFACSGFVFEGKLHVLHKGLTTVQIFESSERKWIVEDYGWQQGPMAVVKGELFAVNNGSIIRQHKRPELNKIISPAPPDYLQRMGFRVIGVGSDFYVIGGVILPFCTLSDVDVLNVKSERPIWRKVTPMTRCRGTIVGCTVLRL
eukprot:TRINITY_DN649_c0_g1_i2.p1 TRINITY_DN649_c0_g1~~TRINITY_DN649_c0_g1_i2.p1  ORF type:complete len:343 (-),score=60.12 TRINITY_DN649_c0_g1_i2:338-1366(-)